AELESKELLSLCLKKLRGLSKVRLIDAGFIWTEPHSRRIKVKLTIQKEAFVVEYVVANQQCEECTRVAAQLTWKASVQVRQKVPHKRTFLWLEQLILKHNAHQNTTNIKEAKDGIDFYYINRAHAVRMVEFLQSVVPIRMKTSEQLISSDIHSGTSNYKFTYSVEIVPICKVRSLVRIAMAKFTALCEAKDLVDFYIIDIQKEAHQNGKVARFLFIVTHLGNILRPGDHAAGYDLRNANFNDSNWDHLVKTYGTGIPDIILVKKSYPNARKRNKGRKWKLKTITVEEEVEALGKSKAEKARAELDYELFLRDIEEDPELRGMVNLYKDPNKTSGANDMDMEDDDEEEVEEDFPDVDDTELLEDLMEGMTIDDD
ncbi:ribosome-binding protein, partial [Phlyctochytrium bullatum]